MAGVPGADGDGFALGVPQTTGEGEGPEAQGNHLTGSE
jgi:hypothetical protein